MTQNHSGNPVSLLLVPPENHLLLQATNYLCCYTGSRELFTPVNERVGPHFSSLVLYHAMRVLEQTGSLSTLLMPNCSLPANLYSSKLSRITLLSNKLIKLNTLVLESLMCNDKELMTNSKLSFSRKSTVF